MLHSAGPGPGWLCSLPLDPPGQESGLAELVLPDVVTVVIQDVITFECALLDTIGYCTKDSRRFTGSTLVKCRVVGLEFHSKWHGAILLRENALTVAGE